MGWDTLNIGMSGLQAAQLGLNVTGNNITNASTPGYSRQQVVQANAPTIPSSAYGALGMGVVVTGTQRVYSDALGAQLRQVQSAQSGASTYAAQIQPVSTMLSDAQAGLAPALQKFQTGLQALAARPSDPSVRQAAMSSAQALCDRSLSLNSQLSQINSSVNTQVQSSVDTINSLASQIAKLNVTISHAAGMNSGTPPSSLLDQRDQALQSLSQQLGVTVNTETNGTMIDVSIGNGVSLVTGSQTQQLQVGFANSPAVAGQSQAIVQYQTSNGATQTIADVNFGANGTLGGLLQFRNLSLNQAQTAMGQIATQLSTDFNAQNALGQDINGNQGGNIFSVNGNSLQMATTDPNKLASAAPIRTATTAGNTGSGTINAGSVSAGYFGAPVVAATPLTLTYNSAVPNFTVANDPGGSVVYPAGGVPWVSGTPISIDGNTIKFTISGTPANGDSFTVSPNVNGINDGRNAGLLAALQNNASPAPGILSKAAATNNGGVLPAATIANNGNGLDPAYTGVQLQAGQAVQLVYNAATTSFAVTSPDGTQKTIPYVSGAVINTTGLSFTITNQMPANTPPANGDTFTVAPDVMAGRSYQDGYSALVNLVGNTTSITAANNTAQSALLTNAQTLVQSQSGVNLDEEASNLIQYQQAYQASAKAISVAQQMLDNLFAIPA